MASTSIAADNCAANSKGSPEGDRSSYGGRWLVLLAAAWIVTAGVAVYWNSFAGAFVFDDQTSIVENPTIRKLWPLGPVFSPPRNGETVSGRPLLNLSFALNYAISGKETWSYHLVNLGIHLANALLLLGLLRRTLQKAVIPPSVRANALPLAWAITLLWTVHPLQTEAVTYIVERAESLVAFFYLAMLYAILRTDEAGHARWWLGLAVGACLLGMASKEVMVTAPVLAIVYDRTFLAGTFREAWRRRAWMYVFLAATWLLLLGLVWSTGLLFRREELETPLWWSYALAQPRSILYYLRLAIWPHPLCVYYAWPVCKSWLEILPALVVVLAAGAAVIWAMARRPMWGFVGFWFFAILAPTSSVIPLHDVVVERRMYLPLVAMQALAVMAGYFLGRWLLQRAWMPTQVCRGLGLSMAVVTSAVLGILTIDRNQIYSSELILWQDTAAKAPWNPAAYNGWGVALLASARPSEAIEHFEEAVRIKPRCAVAHNNWGNALLTLDRQSEAVEHFEEAVRIKPDLADAHINWGNALLALDRQSEAIKHYQRALRIKPDYAEIYYNWGNALFSLGRHQEAVERYKQALQIKADHADAHLNLGNSMSGLGRHAEALQHFEQAARLKPDYAEAQTNWGIALSALGRKLEAIEHYQQALRIQPDCFTAHNNWGNAFSELGRPSEGIEHYEQALRIKPEYAEAHCNWGNALLVLGRPSEAIEHYEQALRIKPEYAEAHCNWGNALLASRCPSEAIEHCEQALRIRLDYGEAQFNLTLALLQVGRTREAIQHGREAVRLLPGHPQVHRTVAWLMATHDLSQGGNSGQAVELAERACALTGRKDITCLDTLAAAYASAGRFDDAVGTAKEAWLMADAVGQGALAEELHIRLQLYRDRKPYREPVVTPSQHRR